jgi:hypothetical protein
VECIGYRERGAVGMCDDIGLRGLGLVSISRFEAMHIFKVHKHASKIDKKVTDSLNDSRDRRYSEEDLKSGWVVTC